ncbi:MAG TPA: molybdenum cofactor guanylyltransferase [Deltaproteobacteria bacterium]|jgi:molybdopterin-guanine dinucleotide biosynthesis protein A|nr:molybdenum cofactor guanylyltransferase [Deltaproteobacteria bacterium]HOI06578.1 molybdenum cofactor guanylyltransferase [Deltaproteobacteria bacterium]
MTGIVLIGGRSSRFGSDKVISSFQGKSLVDHVVDVITPLFDEVILIGNRRPGLEAHRVAEDIFPGYGPLGGIYTALTVAGTPQCFVFAADMPRLSREFISYMISRSGEHDVVIPVWSKGREPLHAIYHRRVLPVVKDLLDRGERKIFTLLDRVNTLRIPDETIRAYTDPEITFANINTILDRDRLS